MTRTFLAILEKAYLVLVVESVHQGQFSTVLPAAARNTIARLGAL